MTMITSITDLAQVIQLAIAPVFLLAGIAGFLNVMSARLGRIIDRTRIMEGVQLSEVAQPIEKIMTEADCAVELGFLKRRMSIIQRSISLCTSSALVACLLIMSLFTGGFLDIDITAVVISCFVITMSLLILALVFFLMEIRLATRQLIG